MKKIIELFRKMFGKKKPLSFEEECRSHVINANKTYRHKNIRIQSTAYPSLKIKK